MGSNNPIIVFLPITLLIIFMYVLTIRPQRKKDKETRDMRNALTPGDIIVTIGGIVGRIVRVKDDSLVIAVGADKVKFEIMRWAVRDIITPSPRRKAEDKPAPEEKKEKKGSLKNLKKRREEAEAEEEAKRAAMPKRLDVPEEPAEEAPADADAEETTAE